jgi:hypothetical protein
VTAPIGCDWSYAVYCPIQPPKINVSDFTVPYRCVTVKGGDAQPPDSDPFPWFVFEWDQTAGRSTSLSPGDLNTIDGQYINLWGGVKGWFKWNAFFARPITQITFMWVYHSKNGGWQDRYVYERYAGADNRQRTRNVANLEQYITFDTYIPPGEEIWLYTEGGGDRGDSNDLTYLSIVSVVFG